LTWGLNSYGQLGHGDFKARPYGTNVKALSKEFCIEIAAGLCHCLALTEKGQVYVWGFRQAEEGEPILDRFKNVIDYENKGHHQVTPRLMKTGIAEKIKNISCGGYHNLILSEKGALYSWGDNESGQLGQGVNSDISSNVSSLIPKKIEALVGKEILKVACGESHSIVITKEKGEEELWSWGNSQDGQCGLGDFENKWLPKKINKIWKEETKGISAGKSHSLFLTKGNQVYGCGETKNGAFGKLQDVGKRVNVPFLLNIELNEKEVIDVVAGHNSSAILFK
jgi:alpha-tubulin suppressor-like RCC1 family protein